MQSSPATSSHYQRVVLIDPGAGAPESSWSHSGVILGHPGHPGSSWYHPGHGRSWKVLEGQRRWWWWPVGL